ncbi:hypothetical protein M0638_27830, partial [Roseomonas sp. NAR14]
MDWIKKQLASQSSHSAILLLSILMVGAKAAGIDVMGIGHQVAEALTLIGTLSAAAKIVLPDAPQVPPQVVQAAEVLPGVVAQAQATVTEASKAAAVLGATLAAAQAD